MIEPRSTNQHELWEEYYSKERICDRIDTLPWELINPIKFIISHYC